MATTALGDALVPVVRIVYPARTADPIVLARITMVREGLIGAGPRPDHAYPAHPPQIASPHTPAPLFRAHGHMANMPEQRRAGLVQAFVGALDVVVEGGKPMPVMTVDGAVQPFRRLIAAPASTDHPLPDTPLVGAALSLWTWLLHESAMHNGRLHISAPLPVLANLVRGWPAPGGGTQTRDQRRRTVSALVDVINHILWADELALAQRGRVYSRSRQPTTSRPLPPGTLYTNLAVSDLHDGLELVEIYRSVIESSMLYDAVHKLD